MDSKQLHARNRATVKKVVLATLLMFGFGFALVPLYDVFCDITGLNGKTSGPYEASLDDIAVAKERSIKVQFITQNNESMPWEFKPVKSEILVHPGELIEVEFYARNLTEQHMVAQAVPSLSPSQGTDYFHKTECFCFNQQPLAGGSEVYMPLRFVVDPALPNTLSKLTLSYTLFDISDGAPPQREALASR